MLIGYARVSTQEQDTALQLAAMSAAGVVKVFEEKRSAMVERPALRAAVEAMESGDTLCVYKLDRLARSLLDLMLLLRELEAKRCTFKSLTEPIETVTPAGRLMVQILGAFAQFEREVMRERCAAGRVAALSKGVKWGRPRKLERVQVLELLASGKSTVEIARQFNCNQSSVSRCAKGAR